MRIWNYFIPRDKNGEGWAQIMISEYGMFAAVSDYGDYAHLWTHPGEDDFREFFLNAEKEWQYFARKLCPDLEINHAASFKAARRFILENRHTEDLTKEAARNAWNDLSYYSDWEEYLADDDKTEFVDEPWCFTVREENEQVKLFTQKVMPRLVEILKEDLARNLRRYVIGIDILSSRGFCIDPKVRSRLGETLEFKRPRRSIFDDSWPVEHCDTHDGKLYPRHIPWSGRKSRNIEILAVILKAFEGTAQIAIRWDNGDLTGLELKDHVVTERRARLILD